MDLSIDIETYSDISLKECGVYKYVDSPNFEILLFAYAFNDEEVKIVDIASGENIPREVMSAIDDINVTKHAFNANFERTCIAKHLSRNRLEPKGWRCTMVKALTLGLPGSLDYVSKNLKFKEDEQKLASGKNLIRFFSMPCNPTKANGERCRNLPFDDIEKWQQFKVYCKQDVEVERAVRKKLDRFKLVEEEQRLWELDQDINDRGIKVDKVLIDRAIKCDEQYSKKVEEEYKLITGIENTNSVAKLKNWLSGMMGKPITSVTKEKVPLLIAEIEELQLAASTLLQLTAPTLDSKSEIINTVDNITNIVDKTSFSVDDFDNKRSIDTTKIKDSTNLAAIKRVLELRQVIGKTSLSKYQKMKSVTCEDGRVKGLLQFYGANRTGRWAGRLVQVHNLPQNKISDIDLARKLLYEGKFEELEMLYNNVPSVLSQLIRPAFIPSEGCRFIVADFNAIEARVVSWLAGEKWRMEVFKTHGKIYEASASKMFGVPIEEITKKSPLRQKGKISELALGYQGSVGALMKMGALDMGIEEGELIKLVAAWRKANPFIVKLWHDVERAAIKAVKERIIVIHQSGLRFAYEAGILFIQLPSKRKLAYIKPIVIKDSLGRERLTYEGLQQSKGSFERLDTYGGKLVENCVQAIARDCLREAMFRVTEAGYNIVMHVHDGATRF